VPSYSDFKGALRTAFTPVRSSKIPGLFTLEGAAEYVILRKINQSVLSMQSPDANKSPCATTTLSRKTHSFLLKIMGRFC
jgi:hypothetical protein